MDSQPDNSGFNINLDSSGDFTVGASKIVSYLFGVLFFIMFVGVLASTDFNFKEYFLIYVLFFLASFFFFASGVQNRKAITINATGIYYSKTFVTDWTNFRHAYIKQLPNLAYNADDGLVDRYQIVVEYFDSIRCGNYLFPIPMANNQDKSEYEIIDAIIYFSGKQLSHEIYD